MSCCALRSPFSALSVQPFILFKCTSSSCHVVFLLLSVCSESLWSTCTGTDSRLTASPCVLSCNIQCATVETSPHVVEKPLEHLTINNASSAADVARGSLFSTPLNQIQSATAGVLQRLKKERQRERERERKKGNKRGSMCGRMFKLLSCPQWFNSR